MAGHRDPFQPRPARPVNTLKARLGRLLPDKEPFDARSITKRIAAFGWQNQWLSRPVSYASPSERPHRPGVACGSSPVVSLANSPTPPRFLALDQQADGLRLAHRSPSVAGGPPRPTIHCAEPYQVQRRLAPILEDGFCKSSECGCNRLG